MKPPPPMFPAAGSTAVKAKPTATAASMALPPCSRTWRPTSVARGWPVVTMAGGAVTATALPASSQGDVGEGGAGPPERAQAARQQIDTSRRGRMLNCAAPKGLRSTALQDRRLELSVAPAEEFAHRGEPLDVVAEDLEGGEQGNGEQPSGNAPDPQPEGEADEEGDGVQGEPVAQQHRADEVRLNQVDREKGGRDQQRVPDVGEGRERPEGEEDHEAERPQVRDELEQREERPPQYGLR